MADSEKPKGDKLLIIILVVIGLQGMVLFWGQLSLDRRVSLLVAKQEAHQLGDATTPPADGRSSITTTTTTTSKGGSVILGEDEGRRERLKTEPELKTSDLAFLLGVTNDAITKRIETLADGTKWFSFGEKRYPVHKFQNTYLIGNPLFIDSDPD